MRKVSSVLAVCALAPLIVVAQDDAARSSEHSQHEQHTAPSTNAGPGQHSMGAMHQHMQQMQEQMARIHAATDPDERQRLMQQHMQSMQQHMQSMQQHMQSMQQHMQMMGSMGCRQDAPAAEAGP